MSGERTWLSEHRTAQGVGDAGRARATGSRFGHVWLEIAIFVLLVCTAGAIYFKGALVDRQFTIDHATAAKYIPYAYSDRSSGGHSSAAMVNASALSWACDIKPGYAYPFCGFGLELNQSGPATGIDLSGFAKVTLDITYSGPSERLKLALKNRDLVNGKPVEGMDAKPIGIEFPVKQGRQTIELDLAGATAEAWWVAAHKDAAPDARFDNVVAIDLQTGSISAAGPYTLSIHRIGFFGSAFTAEQWYLLILGVWIGFTALLLVGRLVMLKRTLAARQRRHLQEAQYLESARQAAESASQAKSRFLAHMSHELRTPLNAILGYAQILRSAELGERELRAARTIHDSGEHLLTLIGDILDHSKIAAGKHELQNASFDLREMIRTISEMVRGRAEEKGLGFAATIAADVPRRVLGDQKALRQILINLLGNAVKFTRHGDVALDVVVAAWQGGNV
ncbi:MAG TPA: histidine kinase dimerization/phospho-acceptor domain-containing protein, partial [Sphingomonas sp.]|nr:histidine kinase dimerization/phospho-acceptor domain-containing protein [Sphingomonas sp.]